MLVRAIAFSHETYTRDLGDVTATFRAMFWPHLRRISSRYTVLVISVTFTILLMSLVVFYTDFNILTIISLKFTSKVHPLPASVRDFFLPSNSTASDPNNLPLCPVIPPDLLGPLVVDKVPQSWASLEGKYAGQLNRGGRWKPSLCTARHKMAIVIPYRDREMYLKIFLQHMHPFLQRQQLDYGIYVVEQAPKTKFNRAMLMNIGSVETFRIYKYDCFIFHDVDLYPEDDRNIYSCPEFPRHMSVAIDKFNYVLPYPEIFGGVGALKTEHLKQVNGFSNKFFGWGGEDDDMHNRIVSSNLKIIRYPNAIARYTMMTHKHDVANPMRHTMLYTGKNRWHVDGLNSLLYNLISVDLRPLYTRIYVDIDMKQVLSNDADTIRKNKQTSTS